MSDAPPLLLLVDDDPLISETLAYALGGHFDVVTSHSRPHCRQVLRQLRQAPQAALVDLGLPPLPHRPDEGFALIGELLAANPSMKIIVLSGQSDSDNARHARALGAIEFVAKPCDPGQLIGLLQEALRFPAQPDTNTSGCKLIGDSLPMQRLRQQVAQYANSSFPVLIEGESGSGKDVLAHCCLHAHTQRQAAPFLALNCAAISPGLVEPTLFGHARGAFTGATGAQAGYFEEAGEGTLFLDEIGELPLELQPKLLRVLENGEYQRVGETQTRRSRARIVAATNRDLKAEVKAGRFRADLYHRLSVFALTLPPLREMGADRRLLLDHFRQLYATQTGSSPFELDAEALECWGRYHFPGNVRELRNIVIRLTAKHAGRQVDIDTLRLELDEDSPVQPDSKEAAPATPFNEALAAAEAHLHRQGEVDLNAALALWERAYIEAALNQTGGNVSEAARRLGINRTTLYNRMESWQR